MHSNVLIASDRTFLPLVTISCSALSFNQGPLLKHGSRKLHFRTRTCNTQHQFRPNRQHRLPATYSSSSSSSSSNSTSTSTSSVPPCVQIPALSTSDKESSETQAEQQPDLNKSQPLPTSAEMHTPEASPTPNSTSKGTSTSTSSSSSSNNNINSMSNASPEAKLDEIRRLMGKKDGEPLKVVGVGAGAWGSVFLALLQETYGGYKEKIDVKIWRRANKALDKEFADSLFQVINSREDIIRRLIRKCAYLKYVEARLGDRVLHADEILRDGFCVNVVDTPLCPMHVVTNLQEAVWDADLVINALPSTETRSVFREIGKVWRERTKPPPVVVSLTKGVEAGMDPEPHIVTPTLMIHQEADVPMENVLYLGGPNIASEIYHKEYANARLCGATRWRKPLAAFFRQRNFIVWDNEDLVTHEVMGGLKNVYAIGAGIVAGATQESATSKSVYFAHATSEMVFITHLVSQNPERLAGPLLADTYVTLLKGRNAWYGEQLASGAITAEMGDYAKGKGLIQGVSAVSAFYQVLSQPMFQVPHPVSGEMVAPVELCPILQQLHHILHLRDAPPASILDPLRDETMYDPAERIAIAPASCYRSKLLQRHPSSRRTDGVPLPAET